MWRIPFISKKAKVTLTSIIFFGGNIPFWQFAGLRVGQGILGVERDINIDEPIEGGEEFSPVGHVFFGEVQFPEIAPEGIGYARLQYDDIQPLVDFLEIGPLVGVVSP